MFFSYRSSISPPYTLQFTTDQYPVLCIFYSQLQYQCSVNSKINYRPSTSSPYTLKSTTDPVLVPRILYSPPQTHYPVLCILYNPRQTHYRSSVYSTIHNRPSASPQYNLQSLQSRFQSFVHSTDIYRFGTCPPYILQSRTIHVSVLHILYNPLQTQFLSSV